MMGKGLLAGFVLLLAGLDCLAQGPQSNFPPGTFQSRAALDTGSAASFQGAGDIKTGAVAYWGGQAYTAAYASGLGNAFNVCLALDATCGDLKFGASGNVTNSAIGGSLCSVVTCTIKIIYDHTAGGNCSGSCDAAQATEANRATITFVSGRAYISCASNCAYSAAGSITQAQPFTIVTVHNFTDNGAQAAILQTGNSTEYGVRNSGANDTFMYSGANAPLATANAGSPHVVQTIWNNAGTSNFYVDGSSTTASLGAGTGLGSNLTLLNVGAANQPYTGTLSNIGIWGSAFSGGEQSSMNTQLHTNWGF